jgi:hypothetical protein
MGYRQLQFLSYVNITFNLELARGPSLTEPHNYPPSVRGSASSFNIRQLEPETARVYSGVLETGTGNDERGREFQLPKQTIPATGATWRSTCQQ